MDTVLHNKRIPVAVIRMSDDGQQVLKILSVFHSELFPMSLIHPVQDHWKHPERAAAAMNRWLRKRRIPPNRDGLSLVLQREPDFLRDVSQFSLSDPFWFQSKEEEQWETNNFFEHRYAPEPGRLLFEPWTMKDLSRTMLSSPDRTTNGILRKHWVQPYTGSDTRSILIKAGRPGGKQNTISEVLASMALESLHLVPFVRYSLTIDGLSFCSSCANFITADTEFVPASHLYGYFRRQPEDSVLEHLVHTCQKLGMRNADKAMDAMLTADAVIGNRDRHLGNFGFIRQAETGVLIGMAPLFDFGFAFHPEAAEQAGQDSLWTEEEIRTAEIRACQALDEDMVPDIDPMLNLVRDVPTLTEDERVNLIRQIWAFRSTWAGVVRMAHRRTQDRARGAR